MKIPDKAKKVFEGEIFDTYQWEQEMYDGSTATFERLKRANTIQVIASMDDKVVIILEEQPTMKQKYSVIGGRQDEGESSLECAKRELLEETGLESKDCELWYEQEPYGKMEWTISRYIARNCKKVSEQKLDAGEKIEVKYVSFEEFVKILIEEDSRSHDVTFEILKMHYRNELDQFKQKLFRPQS